MVVEQILVDQTIKALRANGFVVDYFPDRKQALSFLLAQMEAGQTVGSGGSVTLAELDLLAEAQKAGMIVYNRKAPGLTAEQRKEVTKNEIFADYFFCSANAITTAGEIYNVDANGNRAAALLFGPENTYIVAGINKIVPDYAAAVKRVEEIAAPKNAQRLHLDTPCVQTGTCVDCQKKDRICCAYVLLKKPSARQGHACGFDRRRTRLLIRSGY